MAKLNNVPFRILVRSKAATGLRGDWLTFSKTGEIGYITDERQFAVSDGAHFLKTITLDEADLYRNDLKIDGDIYVFDGDNLGSELITNGGMTGDATGWTLGAGWSNSGNATWRSGVSGIGSLSQDIPIIAGQPYHVSFTITGWRYDNVYYDLGGTSGTPVHGQDFVTKTFSEIIYPTGGSGLNFYCNTTGYSSLYYGITNVSVKSIAPGSIYLGSGLLSYSGGTLSLNGTPISLSTHNHDSQYYPLNDNPSGYITGVDPDIVLSSKSGIYNQTFLTGQILYDTGNNGLYFQSNDGSKYFCPFNFVKIEGSGIDIGFAQNSSPIGYGADYVSDKLISQCQIGSNDRTGVDGLIRFQDNVFQIWQNNAWSDVVLALRMREDNNGRYELEHKPVGFDNWYEVANGNSNELGLNGLPMVQQYVASVGAYPVKIHVDGGTD